MHLAPGIIVDVIPVVITALHVSEPSPFKVISSLIDKIKAKMGPCCFYHNQRSVEAVNNASVDPSRLTLQLGECVLSV